MEKINEITPKYVDRLPDVLENGILYITKDNEIAAHLCACGCGKETDTPLGNKGWKVINNNGSVSLTPSIGNWAGQNPYHAHYFIRENKIVWC